MKTVHIKRLLKDIGGWIGGAAKEIGRFLLIELGMMVLIITSPVWGPVYIVRRIYQEYVV